MNASARPRAMALDGHSVEAAAEQTTARISTVQAEIMSIFKSAGPLTDDQLVELYAQRVENVGAPRATPQSIRTRRADLSHRGIVVATNIPGRSAYGNPATVHALAATVGDASCMF